MEASAGFLLGQKTAKVSGYEQTGGILCFVERFLIKKGEKKTEATQEIEGSQRMDRRQPESKRRGGDEQARSRWVVSVFSV